MCYQAVRPVGHGGKHTVYDFLDLTAGEVGYGDSIDGENPSARFDGLVAVE